MSDEWVLGPRGWVYSGLIVGPYVWSGEHKSGTWRRIDDTNWWEFVPCDSSMTFSGNTREECVCE